MKILATGSYLPEGILTNDDLSKKVDTSHEWIVERTGIKQRHVAKNETTSMLALAASLKAIKKSGIKPRAIDLIVACTSTPDGALPSVASKVLKSLGIKKVMAFDLNAACSGFVYGLDVAYALMEAHQFKYALVIGAEVMSNIIDWQDRQTCVLFGDGAGAVVIEKDTSPLHIHSSGIPDETDALVTAKFLEMKGQDVFKFAVKTVYEEIQHALAKMKLAHEAVDYFILHQANSRISDYVAKKLRIPKEKFYSNIAKVGNTSAASIPIVLDEMNTFGMLEKGMKLMLVGFGAGLSYGTVVLEW